jgi:23S rRNA pseudouridine2605 synthase
VAEERLQRALARAGVGSRRASEDLIRGGRVTVNGKVATLGDKVDAAMDRVTVDGVGVNLDPALRYYAFHKPAGVTSTVSDRHAAVDLTAFFPPGPRVFAVGRLDRDTEGLLLLTNDGELANRLMHPRHEVEREYLAEVEGAPNERHAARLRRGVELEDGIARAASATPGGRSGERGAVRIVLTEGRKREVRRMLGAVGLPVRRLVRVRYGPVRLGRMAPGETRPLSTAEIRGLYRVAGL